MTTQLVVLYYFGGILHAGMYVLNPVNNTKNGEALFWFFLYPLVYLSIMLLIFGLPFILLYKLVNE